MKPYGAGVSTPSSEREQGAGVLTPSRKYDIENGTEVPPPSSETDEMKSNMKGAGVSTPLKQSEDGTEVPSPSYDSVETEVPSPKYNSDKSKAPAPRKFLPHIDMVEHYQFVTFRTHDSLDDYVKKIRNADISNLKKSMT